MSGVGRPGFTGKVTVVGVDGNQLMITFDDSGHEELAEYFKPGARFIASFTPIGGDSAGKGGPKPQPGG